MATWMRLATRPCPLLSVHASKFRPVARNRNLRRLAAAEIGSSDVLDTAVPILFGVATVGLTVVTLGVLYLNLSSWWESRTSGSSTKKQKRDEYDESMKEFMTDAVEKGTKGKKPPKKASSKGFGP